jgi:4-amino-4-deoxy-L-arabinose transferase-like glycosyltransferase
MCDVPAVFFSTLSVLTFWLAIKNLKSRTKTLIYFAISGIAVGFAIDSKYTSAATFLVLIFSVLIFGAFYFFSHRSSLTTVKKKPLAIVAVGLILFSGMGALTTIILNPYLYSNPYQQFNSVIGFWSKANTYWGYRIQDTPNDRINAFIGVIHSVVWPGSSLLKSIWSGYQWCWEYPGCYTTVASATSFILGFAYFLNKTRKKELSFIQLMIFMWFLVYLVFISITTWKLWDRYFLPLIPSMTLIAAYGLVSFSRRVLKADWILVTAAIVSHAGNILAWIPELYDKRWLDVNNDSFLASLQLSVERNIGFIFAVGYSIILLAVILGYLRKHLHKQNFRQISFILKATKASTENSR